MKAIQAHTGHEEDAILRSLGLTAPLYETFVTGLNLISACSPCKTSKRPQKWEKTCFQLLKGVYNAGRGPNCVEDAPDRVYRWR